MRCWLALALLASSAAPAAAQDARPLRDLSTDRPDKTESPYTVDAGHFQVELDLATYTRERDGGVRTETFGVAPVNLKLGLTPSTDLQLVVEPFVRQTVTDRTSGRRRRTTGFGDVTVRLKHNLFGNDGGPAALALMPFVKLPTASKALGNGAAEFGLIVPLALSVSDRVGVGLMTEIDLNEESDGRGYAPSFVNSATVSFDLTDRVGLYTELFTERGTERGARWVVTGDAGLTYAVGENTQLDTGVNLGLTDAAEDIQVFIGLSRRF